MESLLAPTQDRKAHERTGSPARPALQQSQRGESPSRAAPGLGLGSETRNRWTIRTSVRGEDRRAPPLREAWQITFPKVLFLRSFLHRLLRGLPAFPSTGFVNAREPVHHSVRRHRLRHILVRSIPRVGYAPVLKTGTTCSTA